MSLLLTMLPIYIFGNLHCIGMCGPLVLMLGKHRYRYFYFLGRTLSFTFAGMIAGELGAVLHVILQRYHLPAAASFFFGGVILIVGLCSLMKREYPGSQWLSRRLAKVNQSLSLLMLRDQPWPVFLFGFFTIALPCGQTVVVYSACALSGDIFVGMHNGFVFAVLTSPFPVFGHACTHNASQNEKVLSATDRFVCDHRRGVGAMPRTCGIGTDSSLDPKSQFFHGISSRTFLVSVQTPTGKPRRSRSKRRKREVFSISIPPVNIRLEYYLWTLAIRKNSLHGSFFVFSCPSPCPTSC